MLFILCIITVQIFLIYNIKIITNYFNLYDYPKDDRKNHSKPIPLFGGVVLLPTTIYLILNNNFFLINDMSIRYLFASLTILFCIALIGIFDDLKDFNNKKRIFALFLVIFIITLSSPNLFKIEKIVISFYENDINTNYLKFLLFPIGFIVLNTILNLIDGKNCILLGCFLVTTILLLDNFISAENIYLLSVVLTLIYFNYYNKLFMGTLGVNLITLILSFQILGLNSIGDLHLDKLFVIFILPFVDAVYLLCYRLLNNLSPFSADQNHFHHHLIKKFNIINDKNCFIFYIIFFLTPFIFYNLTESFILTNLIFLLFYFGIRFLKNE